MTGPAKADAPAYENLKQAALHEPIVREYMDGELVGPRGALLAAVNALAATRAELQRRIEHETLPVVLTAGALDKTDALGLEIAARAKKARERYGAFASPHEAHSVIREELDELWDEVRKKSGLRSVLTLRNEALDVAVAALRYAAQLEAQPWPATLASGDEP